jgi:citrate lyase beta subunit
MRLRRSVLTVPGNNRRFIEKAITLPCDEVILDLEDGVPVSEKVDARKTVSHAIREIDWGRKVVSVRINGLDTPYTYKDILEVTEMGGERLDCIVVPKINTVAEVHFVSIFLDQIEMDLGRKKKTAIEASIETASGLANCYEIAKASERIEALVFGIVDYTISIGAKVGGLSGHGDDRTIYPGHRWHFPLSRIVMAAKAAGIMAIDAPYGDIRDIEGFRESARIASALGLDGKWVIHPSQIEVCNEIFSPTPEEIDIALRVLRAFKGERKGPISLDGRMVDTATFNLARRTYERARQIGLIEKDILNEEDIP